MQKRYEYWSKEGIVWSQWYNWDGNLMEKWQLKNKLRNEYRDEAIQ